MARSGQQDDEPVGPTGRFADDLVGLDPHDPEAQEFAAHLDRMEQPNAHATVEGMLQGVGDFAQGANRAVGERRIMVVATVTLMLIGVIYTVWNATGFVLETFFG